jgi:epoxide hydrolase 4
MPPTVDESLFEHRYTPAGAVRLHYVEAGQGPLVVMLHGFPEAWFSYRYQLPALAAAGYRAVAADMRGYNLSDKPRGVRAYSIDFLTSDIARLIRACGAERAVVVGHDWGAVVAWAFAMRYPALVNKLVILNVPHPLIMQRGLRTLPRQRLKSWYILFFQLPWLPELMFRAGDFFSLRQTLAHDPIRPGAFTPEEIERYVEAMKQPGALTAGINYYRALGRDTLSGRGLVRRIDVPVQVIWGEQDRYLETALAAPDPALVPDYRVAYLPDASHWVQNDRPDEVNRILLDFLGSPAR